MNDVSTSGNVSCASVELTFARTGAQHFGVEAATRGKDVTEWEYEVGGVLKLRDTQYKRIRMRILKWNALRGVEECVLAMLQQAACSIFLRRSLFFDIVLGSLLHVYMFCFKRS
jgi:hypothetical protein